jgi:transcriptional regulator with PAS, ATPase and Fis domain
VPASLVEGCDRRIEESPIEMNTAAKLQTAPVTVPVIRSEVSRRLFQMVGRVALHDAAVLIVGETGSGKEVVVKEIHRLSPRCNKALVEVNCAALPEHLMESELFGYERGAFSGADSDKPGLFEMADGGTILLDEIGEMDIKFQAKLLRVLDGFSYYRLGGSRKLAVNVRVVAATNRDLEEQIREGKFRKDLYYRLAQFQLQVPPLRERLEDVAVLAEHFLQPHLPGATISPEALEALQRYQWPGNVRELKNVMFKAALQAKPGTREIRASDLPAAIYGPGETAAPGGTKTNLADTEKRMILDALARSGGSQELAAEQLGISARTIRRKLEKYKKDEDSSAALGTLSTYQQRYFRVNIELPVVLRLKGQPIEATTVNISAGGLAIRAAAKLPHGAQPEVSFRLPDVASPIESQSRLAWAGPDGLIGLKFIEMHPALERELHRWLLERARAEGWVDTPKS